MVLDRLFGCGSGGDNRAEGERLFQLGMQSAVQFRSSEAIEYYTQSIAASENPAPYINRANLLMKRIRYHEARRDLEEAARLDARQGREFAAEIERELVWAAAISSNYDNGQREKLVEDLRASDHSIVADRIICASFDISEPCWDFNTIPRDLIEFHLFNDLDDMDKFDEITMYPDAELLFELYDRKFIYKKAESCPDVASYKDAQTKLHSFLCSYNLDDMIRLRNYIIYRIHERLLSLDFGDLHESFTSESNGIIREAENTQ